ncbi:flagellar basal body rod protein FlgB [Cytobacillus firmus]|uniref:flagellar basal body rod protein FlgB n=1 Tax=Cytobacillus firmus TaxID=1399 RepID=UPI0018CF0BBC|nr:flagellar basal body rod protein FlgB [Cytobacillus firmus]MBG9548147.1 flagellar basal body rod protein FlgB [Cytobacillus firmus]MBG9601888.1 flagellar basal body rod protein FlgB [Cytobacillus firmus]MED1940862.1 flagellar basal body rod protein FlgB [Cytobacillus firmus]
MQLFSGTISTLEQALNYSSLKQKVISQNIANADTPNYKAKDASFKAAFKSALDESMDANKSDYRHYDFKNGSSSGQGIVTRPDTSYNHNGNSVDLDKEMADLATNQIYYNAVIERVSGKFSSLQNVLRGGK